jgi:hypothetical protein
MQILLRQNRLLQYAGFAETGTKAVNSRPAWTTWTIWTGFCNVPYLRFFFNFFMVNMYFLIFRANS